MYYDLTLKITPEMRKTAEGNDRYALIGHLGTHFDVMNKEFPLSNLKLPGIVFNVSHIRDRDITEADVDLEKADGAQFAAFYTNCIHELGYGNPAYFKSTVQLAKSLIQTLLDRKIKIIGIDCAGIRCGKEHTPTDQWCADNGAFVVENMCGMDILLNGSRDTCCTIYTCPVNFSGLTGLPCRVIAEK